MQIHAEEELQGDRDDDGQHKHHGCHSQPAQAIARLDALAVAFDVLRELSPVFFALGASEGLKALQPLFFAEPEKAAVTAHDSAVEDAAGELGVGVFFERAQLARGHLGGLRDGLERDVALEALLL